MPHHRNYHSQLLATLALLWQLGCNDFDKTLPEKAPRPVTVLTLHKQIPSGNYRVSGAVKSWKTERIGFEVDGRVQWVLEPGEDIERRIVDPSGTVIKAGTPLAKLDAARYEVAVESAEAQLEIAGLQKEEVEIRLNESIPADLKSARSDLTLAETDLKRIESLVERNAVSQAEYDQAANTVQTRRARIDSISASEKQARAELKAADARIRSAEQALRDAERDLKNTVLYADYRGRISDVHVVPGSVVSAGAPVLTLQMMDPIKVEIEVSAEKSREVRNRPQLPISYKLPNGSIRRQNGFVYNIDSSADPSTRTFSLTMLLLNEKFQTVPSSAVDGEVVATTEDIWPLRINRIIGAPEDITLVDETAILKDEQGHYVFEVTNARMGDSISGLLKVKKRRIKLEPLRIPFLGIWTMQQFSFMDQQINRPDMLLLGKLNVSRDTPEQWAGDSVLLQQDSQWTLRPGDLVTVDLSGESVESAYYVPPSAIYEDSGKTSLFVLNGEVVDKLPVQAVMPSDLSVGSLIEVRADEIREGMKIVVGGVHFLNDGDRVRPMSRDDQNYSTEP